MKEKGSLALPSWYGKGLRKRSMVRKILVFLLVVWVNPVVTILAQAETRQREVSQEGEENATFSQRPIAEALEEVFLKAGGQLEEDPMVGTWQLSVMRDKQKGDNTKVSSGGNYLRLDGFHYDLYFNGEKVSEGIYTDWEEEEDLFVLMDEKKIAAKEDEPYYFCQLRRNEEGRLLGLGMGYDDYVLYFVKPEEWESPIKDDGGILAENATMSQIEAAQRAKAILDVRPLSQTGLMEALEMEGFAQADAAYAVRNCKADWMEQAVRKAAADRKQAEFTEDQMLQRLLKAGFTEEEAAYGAKQEDVDISAADVDAK